MTEPESSWIQRAADDVEKAATQQAPGAPIVCASGISPSGPIHLGNLREVMTTHFVAEELKARGHDAVHIHSWDDYDRLRKVPAGIDESFSRHIGQPLASVPDPCGGTHDSWASHFIAEFSAALNELGVAMREIRQSVCYPRGDYNAAIRRAMDQRGRVFDILASFQTPGLHDRPVEERRAAYYPFKPYCQRCGTDNTTVTAYTGQRYEYVCRCGHHGSGDLADGAPISGKLVWKVDWPMRWVHEGVVFEPGGEDHHAPTSSYSSGKELVREIFGGVAPYSFSYSFVGLSGGSSKMSGSAGGAAIPATALDVLEPAIVRWLYARRTPSQSFSIDLTPRGVQRLYDEWDQFLDRSGAPGASPADAHLRAVCTRTSAGPVTTSPLPISFRLLASVADITQANRVQMGRIIAQALDTTPDTGATSTPEQVLDQAEPRLTCAINFATRLVPAEERTTVATEFNTAAWDELDEQTRHGVGLLVDGLDGAWDLAALTALVYGVPKLLLGLPLDTPPTPELKKAQRRFFVALYRLLCGKDTGPRLPTLLLSIGRDRARALLTAPAAS